MRFTKSQSVILALGTIGLFFALTWIVIRRPLSQPVNMSPPTYEPGASPALEGSANLPQSRFMLNEFERSETKDGRKIWAVRAARGFYSPESGTATLENPILWLYDKQGNVIELKARGAVLNLSGASLSRAEVFDGVKLIRNNEVFVDTERAVYDKAKNILVAPGFVQMKSAALDVSGTFLEVNLESKEVKLASEVSSIVRPKNLQTSAAE